METRERWFELIMNETKRTVVQAAKHSIMIYPILRNSLEDLIQDTYLELYVNYDKLRKHKNITGWLVETMYRKSKDRAKHLYKEALRTAFQIDPNEVLENMHSDLVDTPEHIYILRETVAELRKTLCEEIGVDAYRLLKAYYVDGESLDSLANREGITPAALKMRLHRWRRRIQKKKDEFDC